MIGIIFQFGGDIVETRVDGTNVLFRTSTYGSTFVPIDNLYFDKSGVIKEYPDLEGDELWRQKAVERFKEEMKKLCTENKIADYLIKDLSKYGYIPKYKQKQGFRVEKLNFYENSGINPKDTQKDIINKWTNSENGKKYKLEEEKKVKNAN